MKSLTIRNIAAVGTALAAAATISAGTSNLEWKNPEKYSDIGSVYGSDDKLEHFKEEMESYIERLAESELPDGAVLKLVVTNVDLAGEFEPWRIDHDVRIVREIYPPKMRFSYTLQNDGKVVSEGKESLTDLDFSFNIGRRFFDQDQFFYEKEMLGDWIRNDLEKS